MQSPPVTGSNDHIPTLYVVPGVTTTHWVIALAPFLTEPEYGQPFGSSLPQIGPPVQPEASESKPGFFTRFWGLGSGQTHAVEQHRPPQMLLVHSSPLEHTAPSAFFAAQAGFAQYALLVHSVDDWQLIAQCVVPLAHR